jgi:Fic family protein
MKIENSNTIGGLWLCEKFSLPLVNSLPVQSQIGARRLTISSENGTTETYQEMMRPDSTLRGHLTFHLKHEVVNLELLSRLFSKKPTAELVEWITSEPTSQYAKRAGFLYEWMTGSVLDLAGAKVGGNYVDALSSEDMVVAHAGVSNGRWRVRDNMPGTREFCPTVRLTNQTVAAMGVDCQKMLGELQVEFGSEMLLKSAVWLTLRESRSSFQIEGEADKKDRIERFADVLHNFTGQGEPPLDHESLAMLQKSILGEATSIRLPGIRKSPVFVGQTLRYQEVIHYVAPPAEDVQAMLAGIGKFLGRTAGQSPVMRAAVASFGFVYIHPLADGNGRVHRFLINDILRRDGAVPEPLIVPVSGLITRDAQERRAYDQVLDSFSKSLMQAYAGVSRFEGVAVEYEDGITSNFIFDANEDARHAWRFMDYTQHVQFMGDVLEKAIHQEMRGEALYLRNHFRARLAVKEVIEMPDHQVDRVIRSIEQTNGTLSGVLAKEIPYLTKPGIWKLVCEGVESAMKSDSTAKDSLDATYAGRQDARTSASKSG